MKSCAYCGAEMQRRTGESNTHWEKRRYCSIACRNRSFLRHGYRAFKSGRCVFGSPSTAGAVALGRSCNGRVEWVSPEGSFGAWESRGVEDD